MVFGSHLHVCGCVDREMYQQYFWPVGSIANGGVRVRDVIRMRWISGSLVTALLLSVPQFSFGQATSGSVAGRPGATTGTDNRALLNRYCVACHNEKLKTAGLTLDKMDVEKVPENAEVWEKVIRKLRTGAMPPAGLPRPDKAGYDSFATYLETALDRTAAAKPNPGRPGIH